MTTLFEEKSHSLGLFEHVNSIKKMHLRDLLQNSQRNKKCQIEYENFVFDYSRQQITEETLILLHRLYEELKIKEKIHRMFQGETINTPENRSVLHVALRMPRKGSCLSVPSSTTSTTSEWIVNGQNILNDIHNVLDSIQCFSEKIRSGKHVGVTGKQLKNVISIGIGGSYLGPEFVYEALKTDPEAAQYAQQRTLKFLANVDPTDVQRAIADSNPEETLVVIVSKTFTTAETMLNAKTLRNWLVSKLPNYPKEKIIAQHMIAISAAVPKAVEFGIAQENIFGFWDWVGGRYSVCSAVGIVPLALHYGYQICEKFLSGAHNIDMHFKNAPVYENIPVLMGLLGVWNSTFLKYSCRAILPYTQALLRFPAHIQQVDMESNGKHVTIDGKQINFDCGPINFGEPGTNGQHSFYQLIHQGRTVPCEFIGFCIPQNSIELSDEKVSNHDELMSNFFAQPDALAKGKTVEQNLAEGIPMPLAKHKEFQGNRPSFSLLFKKLDAYSCGQLLALYEHRTAVEGFLWGVNSFDQWGVELGKTLATQIRNQMIDVRKNSKPVNTENYNSSTVHLLDYYFKQSQN